MKKNYGILPAENFEHRTVRPTQAPPAYLSFPEVRIRGALSVFLLHRTLAGWLSALWGEGNSVLRGSRAA